MARSQLWRWLIPALIPITFRGFGTIDVGAHLGGAVVGGLLGWWLLRRWDARRPFPHRPAAPVLASIRMAAVVGGVLTVVALGWAIARSPAGLADAAIEERLMPQDVADKVADRMNALLRGSRGKSDDAADDELATLRAKYPGDPRTFYVSAIWELHQGHEDRGADFLRQGLRDSRTLSRAFGNRALEADMRRNLAESDLRRGDQAQARRDLAPVCGLDTPVLKEPWAKTLCAPPATP